MADNTCNVCGRDTFLSKKYKTMDGKILCSQCADVAKLHSEYKDAEKIKDFIARKNVSIFMELNSNIEMIYGTQVAIKIVGIKAATLPPVTYQCVINNNNGKMFATDSNQRRYYFDARDIVRVEAKPKGFLKGKFDSVKLYYRDYKGKGEVVIQVDGKSSMYDVENKFKKIMEKYSG